MACECVWFGSLYIYNRINGRGVYRCHLMLYWALCYVVWHCRKCERQANRVGYTTDYNEKSSNKQQASLSTTHTHVRTHARTTQNHLHSFALNHIGTYNYVICRLDFGVGDVHKTTAIQSGVWQSRRFNEWMERIVHRSRVHSCVLICKHRSPKRIR